jgi:hypothetical protein
MSLPAQTRLTDEERTNLVAFLDGEVDETLAQKLEEKVARSVSVRKEVEALEKTWELLDWLPQPEATADFATQTISRIHSQQLQAELMEGRVKFGAAIVVKVMAWAACIAALASIGFTSLRYAWPDPNRELINQLDGVENLETYRAIPDLKFLDDLSRLGIFVEPMVAPDPVGGTESKAGAPVGVQGQ